MEYFRCISYIEECRNLLFFMYRFKHHTDWQNSIYLLLTFQHMEELILLVKHSVQSHKNGKLHIREIHSYFKFTVIQTTCIWPTLEQSIIHVSYLQQMLLLDTLHAQDNKMKTIMSSMKIMYLC